MAAAIAVGLGSTLACAAQGGHGGGGGHAFGGYGFRGGYGYRYGGFYGYPGWYGFGLGLGLGYGLGYGYGNGYGYPYYPYYPYPAGYPVCVDPGYGPLATQVPVPPAAGGAPAGGPVRLTDADVMLSILVPPQAVVRINGAQTAQGGPRREFVSSGLAPGRMYTFVVTARWPGQNGQAVELEQRIRVQGGERRHVDFLTLSPASEDPPSIRTAGN
jgi:uncharacterized protein (TIGR03000 family)